MLFFVVLVVGNAQEYFIINQVVLEGNKRTRDKIVLRELDFVAGDTVYFSQINQRFLENEKRILNTGLFNNVTLNVKNWNLSAKHADVIIELIENWYIYPAPIFELADRNFNVWWTEYNRSLSRVNYGMRLSHINFSGNKDALNITTQFGYTKKFEVRYGFPYLNDKKTLGFAGGIFYSENKEIGYATIGNKTQYEKHDDEKPLLRRFRVGASLTYRPDLYNFHIVKFEFHRNAIDEFVASELNPDYFLNESTRLRFFLLEYDYKFDKRIFKLYPEGGYLAGINVKKEGLGIFDEYSNLSLTGTLEYYFKLDRSLVIASAIKGKTNIIRDKVAFANNTGLGYGENVVSGFELYVMDGTDFILSQSSIRYNFFNKLINYRNAMPLEQFRYMSIRLFLRFNFDAAYVNEPSYADSNVLNNRWVYGFGPALDIVLYNNYLFQIEYSFNDLDEHGLFLHNKISF